MSSPVAESRHRSQRPAIRFCALSLKGPFASVHPCCASKTACCGQSSTDYQLQPRTFTQLYLQKLTTSAPGGRTPNMSWTSRGGVPPRTQLEDVLVAKLRHDAVEVLHAAYAAEPQPSWLMLRVLATGLGVKNRALLLDWYEHHRNELADEPGPCPVLRHLSTDSLASSTASRPEEASTCRRATNNAMHRRVGSEVQPLPC